MIQNILAWLVGVVSAVISALGYPGIVLLMAMTSMGIAIPSELIMPFAGFLVAQGKFSLIAAATAGAVGENIGAGIAYEIGKRGGRPLILRYGRYLLIDAPHVDAAERFFARWGSVAALIGRLLPIVRSFVAFPAGIARMNRAKFHLFTTLGSWPWCFALAWAGMKLGKAWDTDPRLRAAFHSVEAVVVVVLVAGAAFYIWHRVKAIRKG
ncbi:MAG: DedA family protein [Sphingomonas sp.]|uniref:DedA family protein n=1 Tax=Sphingomonas sp. TaxID=28214 RepID=UPI001203C87E|nr:DedA family protein [Sphingomonas sp.]THD35921.1 MAG: DedA family protein [Sphingomonas sp.]